MPLARGSCNIRVTTGLPSTQQTQIPTLHSCYSGKRTHEPKFVQNNTQHGDRDMAHDHDHGHGHGHDKDDPKGDQNLRKQEQSDKVAAEAELRKQEQSDKRG